MSSAQEVLQTMITPAVLISATGTLIMSTSNRTARSPSACVSCPSACTPCRPRTTSAHSSDARSRYSARASCCCARRCSRSTSRWEPSWPASLLIGFSNLTPWLDGWPAVGSGLAGASVLLAACVQLVRESRLATKSSLEGLAHLRRAHTG
jgi:hypothetical protein